MKVNNTYTVTKRIKLHTKPLVEGELVKTGKFLRETNTYYIFDTFKAIKTNIIKIEGG
jgi:phage-related protein